MQSETATSVICTLSIEAFPDDFLDLIDLLLQLHDRSVFRVEQPSPISRDPLHVRAKPVPERRVVYSRTVVHSSRKSPRVSRFAHRRTRSSR